MKRLRRAGFLILTFGLLSSTSAVYAQPSGRPTRVIREGIDEARLVRLVGNTRPEATPQNDRGIVSDDLVLDHMLLQLKRSPEREAAMKQYIDDLHNSQSPNYHQWLTAEQFAEHYGVAQEDVATVTGWLTSHGFTVEGVQGSGLVIDFSGTAGQVRSAYHTEIHNLEVNGAQHIGNMSDPQIPWALEQVVAGVVSLHDFRPKPMLTPRAQFNTSTGNFALVPGDLATIYNFNPLFSGGISGKGQTIMVIEDTDLYSTADFTGFRKTFGLARPYPSGTLTQVHPTGSATCTAPGVNGDDVEAIIDVEWATAAAPNAAIVMAACADTKTTFGGLIALQNVLNGPSSGFPSAVSISYGESESENGATANLAYSNTYAQAVTEGVSIFVSSGDEGAASSDANRAQATHGITVSGFTSTPYNVSVGGTDFGWFPDLGAGGASTYWSPTNSSTFSSALSYIQEIPWNDSCAGGVLTSFFHVNYGDPADPQAFCNSADGANYHTTASGSGGPSGCATGAPAITGVVGGSCAGYAKPSWQSLLGNPGDSVRDIPDVSLFAANGLWGSYYVICFTDPANGGVPCTGDPSNWPGYGGTSVSSPIMAGIQALVNERTGSRWGNPNVNYYRLAGLEYINPSACNSNTVNKTSNSCIFYDVTQGDNDVDCKILGTTLHNCYKANSTDVYGILSLTNGLEQPAYPAQTGWDFATGIGTVNAYNLVKAIWQ